MSDDERGMAIPAVSVLDSKSTRVMGFPLTVSHQLWLFYLLPSIIEIIIYFLDLATDIAVGLSLLNEYNNVFGGLTLAFLYIPPVLCFGYELCSPPARPPGASALKYSQTVFKWILIELAALVLFPLRPIWCFAERLMWGVEAVRLEDPEREKVLVEYEKTRAPKIETYLFLQAYLHAAPQLILQLVLIVWDISNDMHINIMQGVSCVTSCASMALVTASYQRYESQCNGTRKRIWSNNKNETSLKAENSNESETAREGLIAGADRTDAERGGLKMPKRVAWVKVTDEDNPIGKAVCFTLWFMMVVGRVLALVVAAHFCGWAVLAVFLAHYLFNFLYILPAPDCKSYIPLKLALAAVYFICLIEVGIQFRKSYIFATLFFVFCYIEDIVLTIVWVLWGKWFGWWYKYALFVMVMTHLFALLSLFMYYKYFKPKSRRISPGGTKFETSE